MKIGLMFDNNGEVEKYLHPMFITETWDKVYFDNEGKMLPEPKLTFQQKRRLVMSNITTEEIETCKHLIQLARKWSLKTGVPTEHVLTPEEWEQWKRLIKITEIVSNI